jgi:3-dehydroquinate synthase
MNGLGEIIKLAVILDAEIFEWLEKDGVSCIKTHFQSAVAEAILERSIDVMIDELAPNLFEGNLARAVDFGHTFSMVYEMDSCQDILHGEAVLIDIIFSVFLANVRGILSKKDTNRILTLIAGLPYQLSFTRKVTPAVLWNSVIERAYHRNGLQRIPLPSGIGKYVFANDVTFDELDKAYFYFEKWMYRYESTCECRCQCGRFQ